MTKYWTEYVDHCFDSKSNSVIQNDEAYHARYLMMKMLEAAMEAHSQSKEDWHDYWSTFYLMSGKLCFKEDESDSDTQVYDYKPLVDLFEKYITEHGGSVKVLTRRQPKSNKFTTMLKKLHQNEETKDRVELRWAKKSQKTKKNCGLIVR